MKKPLALLIIGGAIVLGATPLLRRDRRASEPEILRAAAPVAETVLVLAPVQLRLLAAESTYWRGEHDSARVAWTELLSDPAVSADSAHVAEIMTWLGIAAWRLGNYDDARKRGEAALALKQRLGLDEQLPLSYNSLGLVAWNQGRLTDARRLYSEGLALANRVGDVVTATKLAMNVGLVETEFAQFDRARAGFERARAMARTAGETRLEGNALTNLGMLDVRVGDAAAAVPRLIDARRLYTQAKYVTGEQNALGQLSTAYAALGDVQHAFATLDSANALALQHGLKQDVASNLEIMADLYLDAGDARKALQHYERAQELNRDVGLETQRGTVLRKMAQVQLALGASEPAYKAALEAAQIHQSMGARFEELQDRLLLAKREARADSPHMQRAQALVDAIGTPAARSGLALTRARMERSDPALALSILSADSLAVARAGFDAEAEAASLRADAFASQHRVLEAQAAAGAAIDALERGRTSIGSGLLRASFVAHRAELYEQLIAVHLRLGSKVDAFRVAEFARVRNLGRPAASKGATAALQRVRKLNEAVNELDAAVANGESEEAASRPALARELANARAEYENLVARGGSNAPTFTIARVEDISAALRPNEVMVEYFVGREHVYAFLISRNMLRAERLAITTPALVAKIRLARASLAGRDAAMTPVLDALHGALLAPFASELRSATRITIVPHAALTYMPFAALHDARANKYLVEDLTIAYAPSGTELLRARQLPAVRRPGAVVFEPFPNELPGSRAEAKAVRSAWRGVKVLRSNQANVTALRAALGGDAIVHVTSHGAMDARTPLFSFLALAANGATGNRFEIHDVFADQVRAPLVYLSGCETGLGNASNTGYETGDDASTFAQAFLAAGARAVVSTAWRIEDKSAAVLAGTFYRFLRTRNAAGALAEAQRTLLKSERYPQPFYWAPYLLTGEVTFGPADD